MAKVDECCLMYIYYCIVVPICFTIAALFFFEMYLKHFCRINLYKQSVFSIIAKVEFKWICIDIDIQDNVTYFLHQKQRNKK